MGKVNSGASNASTLSHLTERVEPQHLILQFVRLTDDDEAVEWEAKVNVKEIFHGASNNHLVNAAKAGNPHAF